MSPQKTIIKFLRVLKGFEMQIKNLGIFLSFVRGKKNYFY